MPKDPNRIHSRGLRGVSLAGDHAYHGCLQSSLHIEIPANVRRIHSFAHVSGGDAVSSDIQSQPGKEQAKPKTRNASLLLEL